MGRLIVILALVMISILAVGGEGRQCNDKSSGDSCGVYSACVCPRLNIATWTNSKQECKNDELVCRNIICLAWKNSGIPTQPRKEQNGEYNRCFSDEECTQGGDYCNTYGFCCTDTPIWP